MKLDFEYGNGLMSAELPDDTDVFIPGKTVPDPECLPQDWDTLYNATLESIRHPLGMPPLRELAGPGKTVVFVIPDIVKGGTQPTSHRKVSIKACLDELYAAGVEKKDILLLISNGLHPRATVPEMKKILGEELFNEFYYSGQLTSHDSEDYEHMVDLGVTCAGDPVLMNRYVYECDIPILIGHTRATLRRLLRRLQALCHRHHPLAQHSEPPCSEGHAPRGLHSGERPQPYAHEVRPDRHAHGGEDGPPLLLLRRRAGHLFPPDRRVQRLRRVMQPASWEVANKRTYVPYAKEKYDIMVFGMPQDFHYGNGMGTNPIQMMQALSAQVIRHKRVMKENCVIICSSICNGYFHDERWPYLRELYELFQHDYMQILPDMDRYGEYFATNEEYIRKYRFTNAFHPFHGFSMMSCGHIAEMNTSAIYIVGAQEPGIARGMGLKTRATFEEALEDAKRKFTGPAPRILALPQTFKVGAVHLCMADDDLSNV